MSEVTDILTQVAENPAVESSVITLIGGLFGHLKDLLSGNQTAAAVQTVAETLANTQQIAKAVVANTPVAAPSS